MNSQLSRRWRLAKLSMATIARRRTLLRLAIVNSLSIPYYRRHGNGISSLPANVTIYPTYRCNQNCLMCTQTSSRKSDHERPPWYDPKRELPVEKWASFFEQIRSFRPILFIFGGEPLVYPEFKELIREAKKRKLWVHIATNGSLLPNVADFLVEQGVEGVAISLDGPSEVHDGIRRVKGAFNMASEGARALIEARSRRKKSGPLLGFSFTITKHNYEGMPEAMEHAISLKADFFWACHVCFKTPEIVAKHNAIFSESNAAAMGIQMDFPSIREGSYYESDMEAEDVPKMLEVLNNTKQSVKGRIEFVLEPRMTDDLVGPYYLDMDFPFVQRCDFLWRTFPVQPDGRVSPCLNFLAGNITEKSVAEIWNGENMQRLRKMFADKLVTGCTRCPSRHYAKGSRCLA
jgi:radical SAM protein with 4Fe4S-binding SPASM domain